MPSFWLLQSVVFECSDVSKEHSASIFRGLYMVQLDAATAGRRAVCVG